MTHHKIIIGDAFDVLPTLESESVNLVVTSPPYWNRRDYNTIKQSGYGQTLKEHLKDMTAAWRECTRILTPDGKIAVNVESIFNKDGNEPVETIALPFEHYGILREIDELEFFGEIIWHKGYYRSNKPLLGSYPYPRTFLVGLSGSERILIFRKCGRRESPNDEIKLRSKLSYDEWLTYANPIWEFEPTKDKDHPAVFPEELPKRLIKMYSFVDDVVLDPFAGSFTSTKAARDLGRNSISIEIQPKYLEIAKKRLKIDEQLRTGVVEYEIVERVMKGGDVH